MGRRAGVLSLLFLAALVLALPSALAQGEGEPRLEVLGRWGTPFLRHGKSPAVLAYSGDGLRLAAGGGDGSLVLWKLADSSGVTLLADGAEVTDVTFSPDGRNVLASLADGTAGEWEVETGRVRYRFKAAEGPLRAVAYKPGGGFFTGGDGRCLHLWDRTRYAGHLGVQVGSTGTDGIAVTGVRDGSPAAGAGIVPGDTIRAVGDTPIRPWIPWTGLLARQPPGTVLRLEVRAKDQTASRTIDVRLSDPPADEPCPLLIEVLTPHPTLVALSVGTDEKSLLTAHVDGTVRTWLLDMPILGISTDPDATAQGRGILVADITPDSPALRSGLAKGDRVLRIDGQEMARVEDIRATLRTKTAGTKIVVAVLRGEQELTIEATLDRSMTLLATAPRVSAAALAAGLVPPGGGAYLAIDGDGRIALLDTEGKEIRKYGGEGTRATCLAALPGGSTFAAGMSDGAVAIYDLANGTLVKRHDLDPGRPIHALALHPAGKEMAWSGGEARVRRSLLPGGEAVPDGGGPLGPFRALGLSGDGKRAVAGAQDGTVWAWDLAAPGSAARRLGRHSGAVAAAAVRPDGTVAVTAGADGAVRLWNLDSGSLAVLVETPGPATCAEISPDGTLVAVGDSRSLFLWDLAALLVAGPGTPSTGLAVRSTERGLLIDKVAAHADLGADPPREGERIFAVDGKRVATEAEFASALAGKSAGERVQIEVAADGAGPRTAEVTLVPGPAAVPPRWACSEAIVVPRFCGFAGDGSFLWTGGPTGILMKVSGADGTRRQELRIAGHAPESVLPIPDGKRLLIASRGGVSLLDLETARQTAWVARQSAATIAMEYGRAPGLAFLLNRSGLLSAWSLDPEPKGVCEVAFGAGGTALAIAADGASGVAALSDHTIATWRLAGKPR
ncbi:MAG: PDZ domain-containing protein [Planctomycetes bacterium]|nr:PDZ domain-containing protein [Planctomycetota bacterium]